MFWEEADYKLALKAEEDSGYMFKKKVSTPSLRNGTSKQKAEGDVPSLDAVETFVGELLM